MTFANDEFALMFDAAAAAAMQGPPPEHDEAPPIEADWHEDDLSQTAIQVSEGAWNEAAIPQRPWLARGYFMRGSVTVIAGPGSAGKSMLTCAWACALATGRQWSRLEPIQPLRVAIYNVEDDEDEQQRRLSATLQQQGLTPQDIAGRVLRLSPRDVGTLIEQLPDGRMQMTKAWDGLIEVCEQRNLDVLFLDPLAELHTAEENDNTALRSVVARLRTLAQQYQLAVVLIHHTRKGATAGDPDTVRGASAIVGAARIVLTVATMTEDEANKLGISPDMRRDLMRVDGAKQNYAPATDAEWFQRLGREIGNGEIIAAAEPWRPPSTGASADAIARLETILARGHNGWPYTAKLGPHDSSIRHAMRLAGIEAKAAEASAIKALMAKGWHVAEYHDAHRKIANGWRSPEYAPSINWNDGQ